MPSPSPSSTTRSSPTRWPGSATARRRTRCSARTSSASAALLLVEGHRDAADGRHDRRDAAHRRRRHGGCAVQPIVVPILRAGLGFVHAAQELLPDADVGFIGISRDEETFAPQAVRQQAARVAGRPAGDRRSTRCSPPAARSSHTIELLLERDAPDADHGRVRAVRPGGHRAPARGRARRSTSSPPPSTTTSTTRPSSSPASATPATASSAPPPEHAIMTGMSTEAAPADPRDRRTARREVGTRRRHRPGLDRRGARGHALRRRRRLRQPVDLPRQRRRPDRRPGGHRRRDAPASARSARASSRCTAVIRSVWRSWPARRRARSAAASRSASARRRSGAVATSMGLPWDRPLRYTREFIDGLQPLLAGQAGRRRRRRRSRPTPSSTSPRPTRPILLAALGPEDAGARRPPGAGHERRASAGRARSPPTSPRAIRAAADEAGRPAPRIMALIRICVTDDHAAAYALAQETAARYRTVPSYAAVQDMEGLDDPAELHLIGIVGAGARRARRVRRRRRHRLPPRDRRPRRPLAR